MLAVNKIYCTDAGTGLMKLDDNSIDCIITSPPYWYQRDYHVKGQIGLEKSFNIYINKLLDLFTIAKRKLKPHGTAWINIADSYSGSGKGVRSVDKKRKAIQNDLPEDLPDWQKINVKHKSLIGIPFRFTLGMIDQGWILRNVIIWHKSNAMPESVKDRFTNDFEYLLFFTKSKDYFFNQLLEPLKQSTLIRAKNGVNSKKLDTKAYKGINIHKQKKYYEKILNGIYKGRNMRCVWEISTKPLYDAHFAVFPEELVEIPVKAGCPKGSIVLDPFMGSGTTAKVAKRLGRNYIGFEINTEYINIANKELGSVKNRTRIDYAKAQAKLKLLQMLEI
jgi:DNA modification methylase